MVDQSAYPAFKGTLMSKGPDLLKDLEKSVIKNLKGFVFITGVPHTHRHHRMEVLFIELFLTLAVIPYAALYEFLL